jgi:hypothetical protein
MLRDLRLHTGFYLDRRCTYPSSLGGPGACALQIADVNWRSRRSATNPEGAPGTWEHVVGQAFVFGVYEKQQWYLCDSYFIGQEVMTGRRILR